MQLEKQLCPVCRKKTLIISEEQKEVPYFGKLYIFSMKCSNCNYFLSDLEAETKKEPCKYTYTIQKKKDLSIRVVKSSAATIKIPQLRMNVNPGPSSQGYISNIEGVLKNFEKIIEDQKNSDDTKIRKHAKNLLKKLWKVKLGEFPLKIIIEDPSGNSAIISDKSKIEKLK